MEVLPYLLLAVELASMRQTPVGEPLHVRLTTAVGSYATKPGAPVTAVLIAPVTINGETILPEGSILNGYVKSVTRVGLGFVHEKAALALEFNRVTPPGGESFPILDRVDQVDNGREQVGADGNIHGVRSTSSLSYRVSGYIRTALSWEIHAGLAFWAIKTLVVQVPEPELYFPAGSELTLKLTGPLLSNANTVSTEGPRLLTEEEHADLDPIVEELPYRAYTPGANRPSDLVNMMFIGSHEEIAAAFAAAGWREARPVSFRSNLSGIRAVAEGGGSRDAPMSSLLVNNVKADMSWQKGLDDYWKRDHIRVWKESATYNGQEIWVGAATRDVNVAFLRPGQKLTHRIEEDVDRERDKIVHDLEFTSCVDATDVWDRSGAPRVSRNATGDPMTTDTGLAVIRFNTCQGPRLSTQTADSTILPRHGNRLQRILRRQILSARSDLLRTNIYWRSYEGTRWMIAAIRRHRRPGSHEESAATSSTVVQPTGLHRSESLAMSPFSQDRLGWLW